MKISKKTDYAIRLILELSLNYNKKLRIRDISKRQKIPFKFLQYLVSQLHSAGYINTFRGKDGGIVLSKNPKDITLKEIIVFFEKSLLPVSCLEKEGCSSIQDCVLYPIWRELKLKIEEILDKITFQDIVEKSKSSHYFYYI